MEGRKRGKYEERALLSGTFAPLVCSVYGTLAPEAAKIISLVTHGLDEVGDQEKSHTVAMQHFYLQTAIVKATSSCLRSRTRQWARPTSEISHPEALDDCTVAVADAAPHPPR